jgi:hypothetical protein
MLALALILLAIAGLLALTSSIWLIVNAFRTSVGWGLAVMFLPFGQLIFTIKNWEMAQKPFYCLLLALLFWGASTSTMPDKTDLRKLASKDAGASADPLNAKKPSTVPGMFTAQKKMEIQIRLVALQKRSDDLLDRKAALTPNDRAGALALAEEIKKYNEDRKTLTQQMHDQGMDSGPRVADSK